MSDLTPEKIREAVARADEPILSYLVATRWSQIDKGEINPLWLTGLGLSVSSVVTDAALAYADLLANAEPVWWCEHHGRSGRSDPDSGAWCQTGWKGHESCGPRLLVKEADDRAATSEWVKQHSYKGRFMHTTEDGGSFRGIKKEG